MKKILIEIEYNETISNICVEDDFIKYRPAYQDIPTWSILASNDLFLPLSIEKISIKEVKQASTYEESQDKPFETQKLVKGYEAGKIEVLEDSIKMFYSLVEKAVK